MEQIKLSKYNETFMKIDCSPSVLKEIQEKYTFMVPGAKFTPKFRLGVWDGKIRLVDSKRKLLYAGLYEDLIKFNKSQNYQSLVSTEFAQKEFSEIEALELIKSWNVKYTPKDYQLKAFIDAIRLQRALFLSVTASGKSFIIYLIMKYFEPKKKLLIVPTINLLNQMKSDFMEYDLNNTIEKEIQIIKGGETKDITKNLVISTWQSIYKMPKEWFDQFDVVIGDEADECTAKSLKHILESLTKSKNRYGFTGTLNDENVHQLVLIGLFGPLRVVSTYEKLMKRGDIADLKIKCITFNYKEETKKSVKKAQYEDEIDWIFKNPRRNRFIENLALSLKGNTLVIFSRIEHGETLYNNSKPRNKFDTYLVHGKIDDEDREIIRKIINSHEQSLTFASSKTFSRGINIPNLHNIIFASPSKSRRTVLQSIGRGLRTGEFKTNCSLYDLSDDLSHKSWKNHTLKHFIERIKIYEMENFNYKTYQVLLEK